MIILRTCEAAIQITYLTTSNSNKRWSVHFTLKPIFGELCRTFGEIFARSGTFWDIDCFLPRSR